MNGNKITGVGDGVDDSDVMTKGQFDKIQKYYYFTDKLGTRLYNKITFPPNIDSYPFGTPKIARWSSFLLLYLEGYYQITYTDYYKGSGEFEIKTIYPPLTSTVDDYNYKINLQTQSNWTPITINIIKTVQMKPGDPHSVLFLSIVKDLSLLGRNYSTFYM